VYLNIGDIDDPFTSKCSFDEDFEVENASLKLGEFLTLQAKSDLQTESSSKVGTCIKDFTFSVRMADGTASPDFIRVDQENWKINFYPNTIED